MDKKPQTFREKLSETFWTILANIIYFLAIAVPVIFLIAFIVLVFYRLHLLHSIE